MEKIGEFQNHEKVPNPGKQINVKIIYSQHIETILATDTLHEKLLTLARMFFAEVQSKITFNIMLC